MFGRRAFLGQVPLVLGPSSWGQGMVAPGPVPAPLRPAPYQDVPPYYGEWGVVGEGGEIIDSGSVGPFDTTDEAFAAAVKAATDHGATELPTNGFAQVKDSNGRTVGPIT